MAGDYSGFVNQHARFTTVFITWPSVGKAPTIDQPLCRVDPSQETVGMGSLTVEISKSMASGSND